MAPDWAGTGSFVVNLRTQVVHLSREMAQLLGAGDAPLQLPFEEYRRRFFVPDAGVAAPTSTAEPGAGDASLRADARMRRADGRVIWVRTASLLRADAAGDPVRMGIACDISEQRKASEALAQSEPPPRGQAEGWQRMALAMEYANDAILLLTEEGRILEANQQALASYGYSLDELRRLTIADLRDPSTLSSLPAALKAAGTTEGAVFETRHRRKDGTVFPVETSSRLVEIEGRRRRLSIIRDITSRKEAEQEVERHQLLLERRVAERTEQLAQANRRLEAEIAERKRTEEALRESEEKYRLLITQSSSIVLEWDPEGRVLFLNPFGCEFLGFRPEEILGRNVVGTIVAPRDEDGVDLEQKMKVVQQAPNNFYSSENENRKKNGEKVWIAWTNRGIYDATRRLVKTISFGIDRTRQREAEKVLAAQHRRLQEEVAKREQVEVELRHARAVLEERVQERTRALLLANERLSAEVAERRRAADQLRTSKEWLRVAFMAGPDGYVIVRRDDGRICEVNDRMVELLGYTREEMIGRTSLELGLWVEPEARQALVAGLQATGQIRGFEMHARRKNGETFWISYSACYLEVEGPPLMMGVVHDITERRRAEAELREAEELYRGIFEGAAEGIYRASAAGQIIAANTTMARILGYDSPGQVIAHAAAQDVPPWWLGAADRDRFVRLLETQGRVSNFECQLRRRDGTLIWALTSARLVRGTDGRPLHYEGFITDITERRRLEDQFLRVQRLENIGMLAAGIAHDLNNVLAPIGMAAQLLRLRHSDPTDLRILTMLESSAERGAGLVRQILGFSRGVSGAPQLVQVKHVLRDMIEIVHETFPRSISVQQSLARDLWPVMANPTQLHQVLLNLCVNARDAMPHGGALRLAAENRTLSPEQAAAIEGARPGHWVVLQVEDSGTGMPPEVLAHIWDPFFTTKAESNGTGLGLPTVRGIVETHGGFITVATEVGRGSRFHVYLPAAESTPAAVPSSGTAAPPQGRGEKILFVDDEATIRETIADTLTALGYVVVVAENGAKGTEVFRARPDEFALVVTDLEMPVMNGRAFAQNVRALRPSTKILAASGLEKSATDIKWTEFADEFLQKPFSAGELVTAVQKLLAATKGALPAPNPG